jgi:hypothetical protein
VSGLAWHSQFEESISSAPLRRILIARHRESPQGVGIHRYNTSVFKQS